MLNKAIEIASNAHFYQKRKLSGLPYIVHPLEVMQTMMEYTSDEFYLSVAVLHDVIEDCDSFYTTEILVLGPDVHKSVLHLTKGKTKEETNYRLYSAPDMIQLIKVADIKSNTKEKLSHNYLQSKIDQIAGMSEFARNHVLTQKTLFQIRGYM